jgi:uncharacterized protein YjdB
LTVPVGPLPPAALGSQLPLETVPQVGAVAPKASGLRVAAAQVRIVRGTTVKVPVVVYPAVGAAGTLPLAWTRKGTAVAVGGTSSSTGSVEATFGKKVVLAVKGVKKGTSTVRVTAGGRSVAIKVTVVAKPVRASKVVIRTKPLKDGKTVVFAARVAPSGATGVVPRWKSSRPSVASIDATGKLTAKKKGKTVVTATVKGAKAKVTITVG